MLHSSQTNSFAPYAMPPGYRYWQESNVSRFSAELSMANQYQILLEQIRVNASHRLWVTLINPPFIPNEEYLASVGLSNYYVRIIHLNESDRNFAQYIRQLVQNGKSSLVAYWCNNELYPDFVFDDIDVVSCKTLIFGHEKNSNGEKSQLELLF